MFDADRRLVVCNQRYAQMYTLPPELVKVGTPHQTIIGHRVKHGILASENTETAANQKLETLNAHSTEKTSSRVDKLADGRLVKVTRDPMLDGGWVAIHEDVTDQTRRDFIELDHFVVSGANRGRVQNRERQYDRNEDDSDQPAPFVRKHIGAPNGMVRASQETSTNVENAAVATNQLSESVMEISQQVDQTTEVVRNAVSKT